jgi:hypothetical protein
MKIVINTCFGGFRLSEEGETRFQALNNGISFYDVCDELNWSWNTRTNAILVQLVEENSKLYGGPHSALKVVDVPDDVDWYIHDYDGMEHVAETHRTWG